MSAVGEAAGDSSVGAELGAVLAFYRARIDAVRRSVSPRDIVVAVRAILNEQIMAVRAIVGRGKAVRPPEAGVKATLQNVARN